MLSFSSLRIVSALLATVTLGASGALGGCSGPSDGATSSTDSDDLTMAELPIVMNLPEAGTFTQEIDHPRDTQAPSIGTFAQRYWVSRQFARGDAPPVLFYLCGEAACSADEPTTLGDTAKALGAVVVALEHRYYGESNPYPDYTREHMKYLTIHNALEDAAAFERWAQKNLALGGKWITIGGSYPGMLAAFFREKHPELVVGAWASSAPVDVQKTFWGYDAITAKTLGPTCAPLYLRAVNDLGAAYDNPNLRPNLDPTGVLSAAFGAKTKADFLNTISGIAMSDVQYNVATDLRALCAALEQHPEAPAVGLVEVYAPPLADDDNPPPPPPSNDAGAPANADAGAPVGPRLRMARLQRPAANGTFVGSEWLYQVCTEVGFYQVFNPDRNASIMSEVVNEAYYDALCDEVVQSRPSIDATREEYVKPLLDGKVTNVLFVNGSTDPWSSLGFPTDHPNAPGITTYTVQRGSHCEDLQTLTPGKSLVGVFEVHKLFHDLAKQWIASAGAGK